MIEETATASSSLYGLIGMGIVTIGSIAVAYFQYKKPKIDGDVVDDLTRENKTLHKNISMLQIDVARLTEQVKSYSKEKENFEATIENLNAQYKVGVVNAIEKYKLKVKGIFQSTNLVLGHVTDYIDNEQQASLLKDLQKTLQNEIN